MVSEKNEASAWVAWILFGGVVLLLLGGAHVTVGTLALWRPEALEGTRSDLLLDVGLSTLGWVHLVLGIVLMVVAGALILGRVWARFAAIALALVALLINFAFASVYPVWSVVAIGFSLVSVYAVAVHGGELTAAYRH
ncbi:DUF7144 family membrane protein [Paractinoplanes tereljensis]|uniref:DUF7144 family membrane protein n=1 Tax=Paractinoplanes tereljensis TaxID=571912 RepID=UPI003F694386